MSKMKTMDGICTTCTNMDGCSLSKKARGSVTQCEEFACKGAKTSSCGTPGRCAPASKSNGYMGLCCNCEVANKCKYPKPEGGVWSCEEYR
jgi:hypothetical protein